MLTTDKRPSLAVVPRKTAGQTLGPIFILQISTPIAEPVDDEDFSFPSNGGAPYPEHHHR